MAEKDWKQFDLIYESLVLEGQAENLTDTSVGMVLTEQPPAWLPVIHGRLKYLIISSKAFQEKKRAEYNAETRAKKLGTGKGKERGNILKELGILG